MAAMCRLNKVKLSALVIMIRIFKYNFKLFLEIGVYQIRYKAGVAGMSYNKRKGL